VPLVFDLGYMDVPFGQEEATSSNDIPLVERAAISNVATTIFANDFRSAFGARSFSDRYWVGAYVTGPTSGTNHTTGEQLGALGRAGYNILYSPEGFFHLEADVGALLKPPAPGGIRSITLSDRPELRVDPTQILSTGSIGIAANPLKNAQVYGGGGIVEWRNFLVDGEAYLINVNRQGLATNSFEGGYIEGSWILTGEQRKYSPPAGTYLRPVPEQQSAIAEARQACEDATQTNLDPSKCVPVAVDDSQVFDPGPLFSVAERAQDQQANLSTLVTPPRE
jgi:phosphate-selective porin OprO/OprP